MKRVLVVSDLHAGCREAIIPPWIETGEMKIGQSKLQSWMWQKWRQMTDESYDVCIVLGDMVNGVNGAERGAGNWTNDMWEQIDCASGMLNMIDAKKFVGVQGSPYHTDLNASGDEAVMRAIGGDFGTDMFVDVEDVRFYAKHAVGTSSVLKGRSTSINGDMEAMMLYKETYGKIDVHLRGHAHYCHGLYWEGALGVIAPCWKWKDNFMRRGKVAYGNDIGWLTFDVEDGNYQWGARTWKVPKEFAVKDIKL